MLLHITHTTTYRYDPQVSTAQHMVHVLPHSSDTQTVSEASLHISPEPASRNDAVDVYGNVRTFFSLPVAHEVLTITAHSVVDTHFLPYPPAQALDTPAWEKVRAHFVYHAGAAWDAATEFVSVSYTHLTLPTICSV